LDTAQADCNGIEDSQVLQFPKDAFVQVGFDIKRLGFAIRKQQRDGVIVLGLDGLDSRIHNASSI
jgi:hypothetical protein